MTTYLLHNRDLFLAQRRADTAMAQHYAAQFPEHHIIVMDCGDEVICDACNGDVTDDPLWITAGQYLHCETCRTADNPHMPEPGRWAVQSIRLERADGPLEECVAEHLRTWAETDEVLQEWAHTAPEDGCYHKCDFTVTWHSGETYAGRFDLQRQHCEADAMLQTHMRHHLDFVLNQDKTQWHAQQASARALLQSHDL